MNNTDNDQKILCIGDVNQDNILSDGVFEWLFSVDDELERQRIIFKLDDMAEACKQKTRFAKLLAAARKEKNKDIAQQADEYGNDVHKGRIQKFFDGEFPKYPKLYTGNWIADKNGIKSYGERGEIMACYHPVTIVNFFKNAQTGDEKVRLAFKRNGVWTEITPSKDVIASANKIVSLSNTGLSVTSETAKYLVRYLNDLEGINQSDIETRISTTKLGWMTVAGKRLFIPYDSDVTFDGEERFRQCYESVSTRGTADAWIEKMKDIRAGDRVEPRIMLAASFASALVSVCHALPFIVNLFGQSEGGKTICLMIAASVWGNPDKDAGLMGDFLTTNVAIEARADLLNHLPLILDDTSKVSKKLRDDFGELVYTLANGTGKDRSNANLGLRRTNNWTNCILTNGEHPIVSESDQGGAINRVIEVQAKQSRIFDDGHAMAEFLKGNYGHAGKLFVDQVKSMELENILFLQRGFESELMRDPDRLQKQCISASLILTADTIASDAMFKDGRQLTCDDIGDYIKKTTDISEDEKCLEYIYEKIAGNMIHFVTAHNEEFEQITEVWGRIDEKENRAYIIKNVFERMLGEIGYSPKSFLAWADSNGLIWSDADRPNYKRARIYPGSKRVRTVALYMGYGDELDGFTEMNENDESVGNTTQKHFNL